MQVRCPKCDNIVDVTGERVSAIACGRCGFTIKVGMIDTISPTPRDADANKPNDGVNQGGASPVPLEPIDRNAATVAASGPAAQVTPPAVLDRESRRSRAAASDAEPPKVLRYFGDYELLDEIARGGMGVVYRARQKSLNRVVAVKMILGGQLAGEAEVERFHTEAEAAANLHHPNIVAIHEVGEHNALHYFSMDFVEGKSLAAVVHDNPLAAPRAATYVRKIAEAIHYAHQHGILHRDLKPSNVLIDEFDEPRVMDFGLAKRLESQSGLTASGAVLGTPSYMPPEQAAGEHKRVGPASDVYSLGAMLYELVTGRPPFRAESPIETMRQVLDVEPAAPRLLNPRVDRDLETICSKCLQKEPERRYTSAQLLADDLARYLRGEPIHARPIGNTERFVRWCRRNPWISGLSAAVAGLLVLVTAGSLVAAFRIAREQRLTELARQQADANFRTAESQRRRAENNFASAREAVHQMLTHVAEEVLPNLPQTPQTEPVREALLQDAMQFYQKFLTENAGDAEVRRELAQAFQRVGQISRLLGDQTQSREAFEQAIRLFDELVTQFPGTPEHARGLATAQIYLGELFRTSSRPDAAEASYRRAIELLEKLHADHPSVPEVQKELARALNNLGLVLKDTTRYDDAAQAYAHAMRLLDALRTESPDQPTYMQELARVQNNRGILLKDTNRAADAEQAYRAATDSLQPVIRANPYRAEYRVELASYHTNLGNLLLRDVQRRRDAEQPYTEAKSLLEQLARDSPSVPRYRQELANCCNSLANLLRLTGRGDAARPAWQQARELAEQLVQEDADIPDYHHLLGGILGNVGNSLLDGDDAAGARDLLEQAIGHHSVALESNPQQPVYRQFLRTDYSRLARVQLRLADHAKAAEAIALQTEQSLDTWPDFQRAISALALCVTAAEKDERLSDQHRSDAIRAYAGQAASLAREAAGKGMKEVRELATAAAFDPLRRVDEFQKSLGELDAEPRP